MRKILVCLALMASTVISCVDVYAQRGGGGFSSSRSSSSSSFSGGSRSSSSFGGSSSFRSSSSGSSWSSKPSSSSSSSGWSSKPSSSSSSSGWNWSSKPATKPTTTNTSAGTAGGAAAAALNSSRTRSVDTQVTKNVKSAGSTYSSKESAISAFKSKYSDSTKKGGQFSSYYEKEPTSRPQHIPTTTVVNNTPVNVVYNSTYGGYGYMHPTLGTWMMYDMLSDAIMLDAMSRNHGYVAAPVGTNVVYHNNGFGTVLLTVLAISLSTLLIIGIILMIKE